MSTEGRVLNNRMETPGFHRAPKTMDVNDVEMVFGTPASPRGKVQPDVHLISNERTNNRDKLPDNNKMNGDVDSSHSSQPLLEPDKERPKPPLAGPEVDDLDSTQPADATPYPGIDDGLLEPNNNKPEVNGEGGEGKSDGGSHDSSPTTRDDGVGTEDGKWPWPPTDETDYPYDLNGLDPRFGIDDRPLSPMPGSIPDVNTYQQKKNLAQGMMDLALLSANANQLRYVLESSTTHPYYYPSLTFISFSIILQIAVGIGLIMNSRYNVKDDKDICKADKINNMTVLGVFLVTIVNVFITSFSVATPTTIASMGTTIQQAG